MSNRKRSNNPLLENRGARPSPFALRKTNGRWRRETPAYGKGLAKHARRAANKVARNARRAGRR